MEAFIIKRCQNRIPAQSIQWWIKSAGIKLKIKKKFLTIAFVSKKEIKKLNKLYRKKNKPTDILSFSPVEPGSLGELAISLDVIKAQANEHGLIQQFELGYMLIHGMLHLLGHDHKKPKEAKKMFKIQDELFQKLCREDKRKKV
jgi:probable rRNA maturation factor